MHNDARADEAADAPARIRHDGMGDAAGKAIGLPPAAVATDAYEAAFRASPVALALARDPHCAVVLRNAAMNRLVPPSLDWRAWRLPDGSSPPVFEGGVTLPLDRQPLRLAAFRGEPSAGREIELRWPGSAPVFLRVAAAPLLDAAGAPCGAVASAIDITAEKRAARERSGSGADAASRAKDDLLGLMGHELRNPLNAIATAVEVLNRAEPAAPEAHSARRIIGRQTRRLAELIGELSDAGRALAEPGEPVRRTVDLGAILAQCMAHAASKAEAKRQSFRPELADVRVEADPGPLAGAIDRLFEDALRSAPEGRTIGVRLRRTPDGVAAVVEIGDAETLAAAPGPGAADRAGLGIAFVRARHAVERSGGRIDVRRHDPALGGTVYALRLPAVADAPSDAA